MEFTWHHVIILAEEMFRFSDEAVACRLKVNRSTIYRHRCKNISGRFRYPEVNVYDELFKPSKNDSDTLKDHFANLKRILEKDIFPDEARTADCSEYKQYIEYLLKLADKNNRATKPSGSKISTIENQAEKARCNSNEDVFNFFNQAFFDHRIKTFVESVDPTRIMDCDYIEKCDEFIKAIRSDSWIPCKANAIKETEKLMQKIHSFVDTLDAYITYLGCNMCPADPVSAPTAFVPLYRDENVKWAFNFAGKVQNYRQQLVSIYQEICNDIN